MQKDQKKRKLRLFNRKKKVKETEAAVNLYANIEVPVRIIAGEDDQIVCNKRAEDIINLMR